MAAQRQAKEFESPAAPISAGMDDSFLKWHFAAAHKNASEELCGKIRAFAGRATVAGRAPMNKPL